MLRVRASLVQRALLSRRLSTPPMHALSSYLRQATSSLSRAFSSTSQPAAQTVHAENIPVARGPQRTPLNLKVGDSVHGFQCVSINAYNDMGVQAYKFVHPVFGCEWLHLDTDDTCNTFSVSFRTVPTDSTGVAHVLEHSVLCGSNRFPVRDPFFNMLRRSLQTFMNAMTGADYTVYPFATQNSQDFVNLLSVYVDAAFFPRLRVEDFWQEGHRVEWAKADSSADASAAQLAFKGIVFNEMKGAMSDSNSRFSYALREALFPPNHTYHHNSGGDPQSIVNLTHTQLVDFHRQHYHPSNARFFTFGDISPHTSMRHVAEHVLAHFPAPPTTSTLPSAHQHTVTDSTDFGAAAALDSSRGWSVKAHPRASTRVPLAERHLLPASRHFECPPDPMTNEDDDKQHRIALAWLCEESYPDQSNAPNVVNEKLVRISATHLLSQLLFECSPAAPLYAALIESGLGSAFIQDSGFDPSGRESVFCVGVQGAKATDFQQIEQVIMDTLRRVCDTGAGLTRERIDSFLHQYELSLAHVPGQRGLALLFRVMSPWTHDADPTRALDIDQTLQLLRKRLEGDAGIAYLRSLISDFALNNKHRVRVTMSPSESFLDAQTQAEKALLERRLNAMSEESRQAVQTRADQLSQSQQSVQDIDVLPTLRRSDIATSTPAYVVNDVSVTNVAVQVCPQPTNGIAYFKASLDIEKLLPGAGLSWTQWDLLPVLSQLTTSMATESRSAEQLALDMNRFTGGVHATPSILPGAFQPTSGLSSIAKFQAAQSLASPLNWPSPKAYWTISSHALQRNADQMMKLSAELFAQPRFHDVKRLKAMIASIHASMTTALQESGHVIARSYAAAALGAQHMILNDRWSGLHQLRLIDSIHNRLQRDDAAVSEFADSLSSLSHALLRHSHETSSHGKPAWRGALNAVSTQTDQLLSSFQTSFLKSVTASDVNTAKNLSTLADQSPLSYANKAFVALPIQVHHVAMVLPTVSFYHPDAPALSLLASVLTDRFLHREIREKGGAYGGGASHSATDGYFSFSSYRDPNCAQTLDAFRASIEWICDGSKPAISQRELDEALLSVFSDFDRPIAPASVGAARFARGVDHEAREEFRKRLLAVRINDVINVARRYLKDRLQSHARVCVVGPSDSVQALQSAGDQWKVIEIYPELKNEIKSNQLERERSTSHRTTPARFRVRSKSSGDIPPNPRTMSGIVVRRLADSVTLSRRGDALTVSKLPSFIDSTNRKLLSADAASVVVGSMIRSVAPGACDAFTPTPVQRECWAWLLDSSPPDTVAIAPTGSGKTLAYMLPIMIEILSTAPSRSSDPVSVAVPLTPEAEQSARAEALSAMKAMATSVFAREISAGKTPEQAHQIASEEGKVVWQRTLREAKQRLAVAPTTDSESSVAASSTTKAEPRALVLVPTRELCQQISDAANEIVKFIAESSSEMANHIRVSCVFGGVDFHRQRTAILAKLPSIMIATPGRLLGLCGIVPASTRARMAGQQKGPRGGPQAPLELPSEKLEPAVSLSGTRVLVLDEADRLLELGFEDDLKAVLELLPSTTRPWTMLFSATWNEQTATLARQLLAATAVHITIGHAALAASVTVEQRVEVMTGKQRKGAPRLRRLLQLLDDFLGSSSRGLTDDDIDVAVQETAHLDAEQAVSEIDLEEPSVEIQGVAEAECHRVIVFVLFKQEAKTLSRLLISKGVDAVALHGDLSQTQRSAAINAFRSGDARVLVATDVAARGLDVKGVELVINYSLGLSLDMYVHRCGRCGRAGQSGIAHSFVVDGDESMAPALVALMARTRQHVSEELRELATEWASKLAAAEKKSKKAQARGQSDIDDDDDFDRRERMANVQKQREMQQKKMQREHAQQKSRPHGNRRK